MKILFNKEMRFEDETTFMTPNERAPVMSALLQSPLTRNNLCLPLPTQAKVRDAFDSWADDYIASLPLEAQSAAVFNSDTMHSTVEAAIYAYENYQPESDEQPEPVEIPVKLGVADLRVMHSCLATVLDKRMIGENGPANAYEVALGDYIEGLVFATMESQDTERELDDPEQEATIINDQVELILETHNLFLNLSQQINKQLNKLDDETSSGKS